MKKNISLVALGISLAILAGLAQDLLVVANTQIDDPVSKQALINAVKSVERAVRENGFGSARLLIALENRRLQQTQVDHAVQELYKAQELLENEQSALTSTEQSLKMLERIAHAENDPVQRDLFQRELQTVPVAIQQAKERIQRLQQRETDINNNLRIVKAKAQELTESLDSFTK